MTNEVLHALGRLALGFFCIAAAVWGDAGPIGRGCLCFRCGFNSDAAPTAPHTIWMAPEDFDRLTTDTTGSHDGE